MKHSIRKFHIGFSCLLVALLAACNSSIDDSDTALPPTSTTETIILSTETGALSVDDANSNTSNFILSSLVMEDDGRLPEDYTCEGQSISPPLSWAGAPQGTVSYALTMHHVPGPGDTHWYWVVYNIPAEIQSIAAGQINFGTFGTNSVNAERAYAPPCSKGEGDKLYTITVYALSASPNFPDPSLVDYDTLLVTIEDITLAQSSMDVWFDRYNP